MMQSAIKRKILTRFYEQNSSDKNFITPLERDAKLKFSIRWINEEISSFTSNIFSSSILWIC
jgi:hypothetical protein